MVPASAQPVTLRSITLAVFVPPALFSVSTGAITPVIPLTATGLGATVAGAAVVIALMGIGKLLADVPAGVLTARFGERRVMIYSGAVCVASLIAATAAPSLGLFTLAVVAVGMSTAVWMLARLTFVATVVPYRLRARAMSTLGGVHRIGFFIGPFAGAAVMHAVGTASVYGFAGVMIIIATGTLVYATRRGRFDFTPTGSTIGGFIPLVRTQWADFATIGFGVLLVSAVRASRQVVIPLWGEHLELAPATISLVYGASGAVDMLFFYPAGRVMDLKGRAAIAVPSMVALGAAHFLLPLSGTVTVYLLVALFMGVGNGMGAGMIMTLGADLAPANQRATFLGLWTLIADTGAAVGPLAIAAITAVVSLGGSIVVMGGVGVLAAGIMGVFIPRRAPHRQQPPRSQRPAGERPAADSD